MSRRDVVRALAAAPLAALGACASLPGDAARQTIALGPASADVTARSALVWHRAQRAGAFAIQYGDDPTFAGAARSEPVEASAGSDLTFVVELGGLTPDREYHYRAVPAHGGAPGPRGRFRTAPETAQSFTFGWSADLNARHQPFTILARVLEKGPHFFLLIGDTMYADLPRDTVDPTLGGFRAKHRENREDRHLGRLLARVPVMAIWDDHEVENDFNGTHPLIPVARRAFREYWALRSVAPDALYRSFAWGALADFFVMDCRQYRSPQGEADGPGKTMLGARQKEWLLSGLLASRAPFKFLVSSVPFLGPWGADKWAGYATERGELLAFIRRERIGGVVVLSADVHTALDGSGMEGIDEFVAGPLAAPPVCLMAPFVVHRRLAATGRFFLCDSYNYGLVTVRADASPPAIEVDFLDARNVVRHRVTVRARG